MLINLIPQSYNEILPGLFIGNFTTASNKVFLQDKNIKLIVNCAKNLPNIFPDNFKYSNVPVYDNPNENNKMYSFLHNTVDKIRLYHLYNKHVLVHCAAGISRSSTVVVAYLIKYHKFSLNNAINFVISKRNIAFNGGKNIVFLNALKRFEKDL